MWAIGAGISTASAGPRPCTRAISVAFQLSPRCVCSTALGMPGRARGEQDERDVGGPAGRRRRRPPAAPPTASASAAGSEIASGASSTHERRVDLPEGRLDVGRAERVEDGRGHGADAPAGPGQDGGGQAVGHLPGDGVAPPTPRSRRPPATVGHQRVGLRRRRAGCRRRRPRRRGRRSGRRASARPRARPAAGSGGPGSAPRSVGGGPSRQGTIPGPH